MPSALNKRCLLVLCALLGSALSFSCSPPHLRRPHAPPRACAVRSYEEQEQPEEYEEEEEEEGLPQPARLPPGESFFMMRKYDWDWDDEWRRFQVVRSLGRSLEVSDIMCEVREARDEIAAAVRQLASLTVAAIVFCAICYAWLVHVQGVIITPDGIMTFAERSRAAERMLSTTEVLSMPPLPLFGQCVWP